MPHHTQLTSSGSVALPPGLVLIGAWDTNKWITVSIRSIDQAQQALANVLKQD